MREKDERKGWEERMREKHCKERMGDRMRRIDARKGWETGWETEWEERIGGKNERKVQE
jgi:hypothetical protein